ncbi:hypothetical protein KUCAC02_024540 [Chaenocephalus aceratus]|uniref:Uncharacterized protein n=1 Tax=Chaenocephalus aceratus TaxID=36190 RepID=A0ACB9WJ41_CHAAC|nr:hypothetical protein KUCAC02_024540 [Chaenocephalus aceratus]
MKEKTKAGRQAGFWEIPEKRAKVSWNVEERPSCPLQGQKDVWSSIQAQWPKKDSQRDCSSDSDTEAANSPPTRTAMPGGAERRAGGRSRGRSLAGADGERQTAGVFLAAAVTTVLNTPPTTPESPSGGGGQRRGDSGPATTFLPAPVPYPPPCLQSRFLTPTPKTRAGGSGRRAHLCESKKRLKEPQPVVVSKKHKPNRKSLGVPPKKNRKTANSSDSEDQSSC